MRRVAHPDRVWSSTTQPHGGTSDETETPRDAISVRISCTDATRECGAGRLKLTLTETRATRTRAVHERSKCEKRKREPVPAPCKGVAGGKEKRASSPRARRQRGEGGPCAKSAKEGSTSCARCASCARRTRCEGGSAQRGRGRRRSHKVSQRRPSFCSPEGAGPLATLEP